jgi:endonuclease/exonuclease/phosphatase family metal-dependent hydrolase
MPAAGNARPASTRAELTALRRQLSREVPRKDARNLLVATWNIREFGGLTEKWRSTSRDTPKRDLHSLACITEIVSRFDVIAIQEAQKRLKALQHMLKSLGGDSTVILTDPTEDDLGDDERLAFVFDRNRLEVSGLACELVVPLNWNRENRSRRIPKQALDRQFARTPYAVTFRRGDAIFTLVTLHVYWGSKSDQDVKERARELTSVATWLKDWAADPDTWDTNLICLGDFNIDRSGSALWQAFTSTNLTVPVELQSPNRQVGGKPLEHFYDQIAWFTEERDGSKPLLSLRYTDRAGMFDWSQTALAGSKLTAQQKSFRISDHYPLWAEFGLT